MADGMRSLAVAGRIRPGNRTVLAAVAVALIQPNPLQPRRYFEPKALAELAASIKARGVLQPIVVQRRGDRYLIMAGERRWRAAQLAGLEVLPVLIRDDDPLEIAMIENLQRQDLTPLEEAQGLAQLIEQFGYTHDALAAMLGKSRPYVSNTLALQRLPAEIKVHCHTTPNVSREILIDIARAETPERQMALWHLVRQQQPSVQKFRAAAAGTSPSRPGLRDLTRLIRHLGRILGAIDPATVADDDRVQLRRLLLRTRQRIDRTLAALGTDAQ